MKKWIYNEKEIDEFPSSAVAFVYRININGYFYFGKKQTYKSIKRKPLKGMKRVRRDKVESNWKKYCSSSEEVKKLVEAGHEPERVIIHICSSIKESTYWENRLLYENIHNDKCLNKSISGKIFKEEIMKWASM